MNEKKRIFALGFFDGVHLGHQALLRECCALAEKLDCQAAAITFDRYPKSLFTDQATPLLSTEKDRKTLLRRFGIGPIYQLPVTREVMSTPWQDFLLKLLEFGAAGFVCGDDFHFGNRGQGNGQRLQEFCGERGLPCVIVPEQTLDGIRVSSTYIRRQIESGDMETAVRFLGHPHLLSGKPVWQDHRTAVLPLPDGMAAPKSGAYACRCRIGEKEYPAVANVGKRATAEGISVVLRFLEGTEEVTAPEIAVEFYRFLSPAGEQENGRE